MNNNLGNYQSWLIDAFCRYVKIDTESDFHSTTVPSTEKQKDLGKLLYSELQAMNIEVEMDENGYVYGKIPSNSSREALPKIFFCAHMDTSPDCSGKDVIPRIHENYQGQDIHYPNDPSLLLNPEISPKLKDKKGHDIITASGGTLLGADNKSGVAVIMTVAKYLVENPEFLHGPIRILFTPDEEIGRGVDHINKDQLDADFGYTMDGEERGSLNWETFSADYAKVSIEGVSTHPGYAKDKLVNSLKVASHYIDQLPKDGISPETTAGKEPFIHPVRISGNAEKTEIGFILRDFDTEGLKDLEKTLKNIQENTLAAFPKAKITLTVTEQYRNMRNILENHPRIVDFAREAIENAGMESKIIPIRGGTDGSRLSYMELPCPNIFVGEYHFHSPLEWTSIQDMMKSTETVIELIRLWEERG